MKLVLFKNEKAVMDALLNGRKVDGRVWLEYNGKGKLVICFDRYKRKPQVRTKDKLIEKLPWGWVKESIERIKVFGSFPKDLGTAAVINLHDEHNRNVKNALIERELMEFC